MRRLKVLLSAYACSPGMGSEAGKGWRVATHMAAHHDVWVITRANNRPAIEAALQKRPIDGLRFFYFDLPQWARFWKRGQRGTQLYYYLWQIGAYRFARHACREIGFDLIHHYSFAKYWNPSFLCLLSPPFVWGPVGGGESAPPGFRSYFGVRGWTYERLRDAARWIGEQDPFVRMTARRCAIAYATTSETKARMLRLGARRVDIRPAIALDDEDIRRLGALGAPKGDIVRFIFIGRLLRWKGVGLAIEAFARAQLGQAELWIIGGGPEEADLRRTTARLGVSEAVRFWGEVPREEAFARLGECNVLVHPSLHDSGGWVCLEAMAARRPVICLDLGGPGTLVSDDAGIRIPARSDRQVIEDIAAAMQRLAGDAPLRARMGEAGRQQVLSRFAWPAKCAEMAEMYDGLVLAQGTDR